MKDRPQERMNVDYGLVMAAFDELDDVRDATRRLREEGFAEDCVSILLSENTRARYLETNPVIDDDDHLLAETVELSPESRSLEGAGVGGTVGGALGAGAAAIAAAGTSVVIVPLGLVIAGPLAAAVAGAGGALGSIVGALAGAGVDELRAKRLERLIEDGRIVVGVSVVTEPEFTLACETLDDEGGELTDRTDDD